MAAPTLTLQLSDKTLKKLRALAMLSGSSVDQLEKDFADYFDHMLSQNIEVLLAQMDGRDPEIPERSIEAEALSSNIADWKMDEKHSIDKARRPAEEEEEPVVSLAPEHALSEDDLPEEVRSTAEQVEEDIMPPEFNAPQAGGDHEAFVDATMANDKRSAKHQQMVNIGGVEGRLQKARPGFDPRRLGARVEEATGDN
jgi:hypothetical protein